MDTHTIPVITHTRGPPEQPPEGPATSPTPPAACLRSRGPTPACCPHLKGHERYVRRFASTGTGVGDQPTPHPHHNHWTHRASTPGETQLSPEFRARTYASGWPFGLSRRATDAPYNTESPVPSSGIQGIQAAIKPTETIDSVCTGPVFEPFSQSFQDSFHSSDPAAQVLGAAGIADVDDVTDAEFWNNQYALSVLRPTHP